MTRISHAVLFLLLNAAWQVSLVGLLALATDRMLRGLATRLRHALWVSALVICVALTLGSTLRIPLEPATLPAHLSHIGEQHVPIEATQAIPSLPSNPQPPRAMMMPVVAFNMPLALIVSGLYGLLLFYRSARLLQAWNRTRTLGRSARRIQLSSSMTQALGRCSSILGPRQVTVLASSQVAVPVTSGARHPVVILPERMLSEEDLPLLLSALGHEAAHIVRRDYLLNLIYELVSLPLWFHPAMRLVLRRIRQTRELRCDEMVTERLLEPRMYAQSLVQLAGAALPFGRPAATITVGIADADILEERIMKILKNSPARSGRRSALVIAALLFVAPCLALAPFAVHVSIHQPAIAEAMAQNPGTSSGDQGQTPAAEPANSSTPVEKVVRVKRRPVATTTVKVEGQDVALAVAPSASQQEPQKAEAEQRELAEKKARAGDTDEVRKARRVMEETELQARTHRQTELARMAKIPIEQAIQTAQRNTPGTVIEARLIGERGTATYLVSILTQKGDQNSTVYVLVNAVDGTILEPEKEQAR